MRQNLLETYSRQIKVAEAYVAKNFDGKQVSNNTKLTTAVLLDNTNRWMTESLDGTITSGPTNRGHMGDWKKFCLNLTNIAVPSLIANDLVIVHPMTSYSGSVAYLKYVAMTDKGDVGAGTELNGVFGMGATTDARVSYTSPVVVETLAAGEEPSLTPEGDVKVITGTFAEGVAGENGAKIAYRSTEFQMEKTPNKVIPTIGPKMDHIALVAEPRRIAVRYDQITAFQA